MTLCLLSMYKFNEFVESMNYLYGISMDKQTATENGSVFAVNESIHKIIEFVE